MFLKTVPMIMKALNVRNSVPTVTVIHSSVLAAEHTDKHGLPVMHLVFVVPCIMLYSGEISPIRCNNCVFYSQWLYSTCFG